jgi:hypothetical protein
MLGSEPKEAALFLPVLRQVFAQAQQPGRRERDGSLKLSLTRAQGVRLSRWGLISSDIHLSSIARRPAR